MGLLAADTQGQQQKQPEPKTEAADDVVRVSTDLVQTGVTVVNKNGKFIDDLRRDDFEIRVDSKPQPISFFELVKTTAPAPKSGPGKAAPSSTSSDEETAGRIVIFFIDDLHLSTESVARTRKMLEYYIDQQMGDGDQVVIASPSGQIGFLQQLTDSREVLHAAVARLKYRATTARDTDRPPMSEYQAVVIERGDEGLLNHYASILIREMFSGLSRVNPAAARDAAERLVHSRASRILAQSGLIARSTLSALESLMRSSAQMPGRKLVIMLSDGFLLNNQAVEVSDKLHDITDAALRAGVVIYGIQASGLNTTFPDAASTDTLDPDGNTGRAPLGEDTAVQAPLAQVAADTGGRALFNANDLDSSIRRALDETAEYYRLAWRPDPELVHERKFHRIQVVLRAHPDLTARIHRGFFSEVAPSPATARSDTQEAKPSPQDRLHAAIGAIYHTDSLPTFLSVDYVENAAGATLMILMRVPLIGKGEVDDQGRYVDIAGVFLDDNGKAAGNFGDRLTANKAMASNSPAQPRSITYLNQITVKPGLYEVRVAAQDSLTGHIGRATRWIEVANVSSGKLSMSSLLIGERESAEHATKGDSTVLPKAQLKIDNRFSRSSRLRFLTYVYNAGKGSGNSTPQVDVQIELLRHNKKVVSSQLRRLETAGADNLRQLPFAEEISLAQLPIGRYVLRVSATDRFSKQSASREAVFQVE